MISDGMISCIAVIILLYMIVKLFGLITDSE